MTSPREPGPRRDGPSAAEELPLPSFVVIGAHRAATRWLRNNLAVHPEVFVPRKQVEHFSTRGAGRTLRSYRLQFRDAPAGAIVGDVSPGYLQPSNGIRAMAQRIDEALPDVRLVAIVRNPVDRCFSAYRDHVIHGRIPAGTGLFDMVQSGHRDVEALDLVGASRYAENLYPFRKRFGDRLLVLVADDIRDDPAKVYDVVLRHIGAPVGFVPPHLDRVLYSNAASRWTAGSEPDDAQRRLLHMLFRRDVEELEAMLGRYLPEWDPGPPPPGWADALTAAT